MATNEIKEVLLWCVGINYGVLLVWFGVFVYAHDWMYRLHTRWFKLSVETFDALHYVGLLISVQKYPGCRGKQRPKRTTPMC
jgi:hypothetical protein